MLYGAGGVYFPCEMNVNTEGVLWIKKKILSTKKENKQKNKSDTHIESLETITIALFGKEDPFRYES